MEHFAGFTPATLAFLRELKANNSKAWFETHKGDYQEHLLPPFAALVEQLAPAMLAIDPAFETRPAVDKTLSRIRRDIRFSRDKSPYRACMWLAFKHPGKGWQERPGFFFELAPDAYRFGMGFYAASKPTMDVLRHTIEDNQDAFARQVDFLDNQTTFAIEGDLYKRVLNPALPENLRAWHNRKNVFLTCNRPSDSRLFDSTLGRDLAAGFTMIAPLYQFLSRLAAEAV